MSSTVYYDSYHTSSLGPTPPYTLSERQHKYLTDYDEKPRGSSRPSGSGGILKAIRSRFCRVFGPRRVGNHKNSSVDSLAYAESDDDSYAESIDEENMAWGRPSKRHSRHRRRSARRESQKEQHLSPRSPDPTQASCRLW